MDNQPLTCPQCNGKQLLIKYEATYVYTYVLDSDAPGLKNFDEFLPFMFDNREQTSTKQYIECSICKNQYPCYFNQWNGEVGKKALQEAMLGEQLQ